MSDEEIDPPLELIDVPKGLPIHIGGIPFSLAEDTQVNGRESNYRLALSQLQTFIGYPCQHESLCSFETRNDADRGT